MAEKSIILGHKEYENFIRKIYFFQKESIETKIVKREGELEEDPWLKNLKDAYSLLGREYQVPKIHQYLPFFV